MFTRTLLLCVCAAVACSAAACDAPADTTIREAVVLEVVPPALRVRAGSEATLAVGEVLAPTDVVRTSAGGAAVLLLRSNGVVVKLAGNQDIALNQIVSFERPRTSKTTEEQLQELLDADHARLDSILVAAERVAGFQHRKRAGSAVAALDAPSPKTREATDVAPPEPLDAVAADATPPGASPPPPPALPARMAVPSKVESAAQVRNESTGLLGDGLRSGSGGGGAGAGAGIGGIGGSATGGGGAGGGSSLGVKTSERKDASRDGKAQAPALAPAEPPRVEVTLRRAAAVQFANFNAAVTQPARFATCAQTLTLPRTVVVDVVLGAGVVTSAKAKDTDAVASCVARVVRETSFAMLPNASDKEANKNAPIVVVRLTP